MYQLVSSGFATQVFIEVGSVTLPYYPGYTYTAVRPSNNQEVFLKEIIIKLIGCILDGNI